MRQRDDKIEKLAVVKEPSKVEKLSDVIFCHYGEQSPGKSVRKQGGVGSFS